MTGIPEAQNGVSDGKITGLGDKVWITFKLFTGVDKSVDNL